MSIVSEIPDLRFPKGQGDIVDYEHCISSLDRWSVGEDHINFRGHAGSMHPGS